MCVTIRSRSCCFAEGLPGRPDLAFIRCKVAVFCDGDFWHGRNWSLRRRRLARGSHPRYWIAKIKRNRERDREVVRSLRQLGWLVIRVWESDVLKNAEVAARRIARVVSSRRGLHGARES